MEKLETIDGVVSMPDIARSNAIIADESEADRFVMGLLRAVADVVVVGSGTMLAAPNGTWRADRVYPAAADAYAELAELELEKLAEPKAARASFEAALQHRPDDRRVLIRLMQWLASRDTFYSYRLVIGPEHLGSVFYLRDRPRLDVNQMVGGIFMEMPGTAGPLKAASTFLGGHAIDRAVANALRHHARAHALVPWREGAGNDETVWEAPGYEVPFVELTRCDSALRQREEHGGHRRILNAQKPTVVHDSDNLDVRRRVAGRESTADGDARIAAHARITRSDDRWRH